MYYLLLALIHSIHAQHIYDAYMSMMPAGYEFQPVNVSVQLLTTCYLSSFLRCARACALTPGCRTCDFDSSGSNRCRLYEADQTTGRIIASPSSLLVGSVSLTNQQFNFFNQTPCNPYCSDNLNLACNANDTCQCPARTYWDGSMCRLQKFTGASCSSDSECRGDLDFVCLQFFQCGREYCRYRQTF